MPSVMIPGFKPSNDNVLTPRVVGRESFAIADFVATRRRLKIQDRAVTEGSVGRILKIRSPGRLYDVSFTAQDTVMTLSHCDIARCLAS
jgi:hypothetical protein